MILSLRKVSGDPLGMDLPHLHDVVMSNGEVPGEIFELVLLVYVVVLVVSIALLALIGPLVLRRLLLLGDLLLLLVAVLHVEHRLLEFGHVQTKLVLCGAGCALANLLRWIWRHEGSRIGSGGTDNAFVEQPGVSRFPL